MHDELSVDEFKLLSEEIALLNPNKVVFTWGEPLLRTDLFDIAKTFRETDPKKNIKLCLISNGTLVNHSTALNISKTFDEIRISLDGKAEVNDKWRGRGTYEKSMTAINELKNAGIFPKISITVNSTNICELSSFLSFLLVNGFATDFNLVPFRPIGRGTQYVDLVCSSEEVRLVIAGFWQQLFGGESKMNNPEEKKVSSFKNCGVGSYINTFPEGSVYPCHVLSD